MRPTILSLMNFPYKENFKRENDKYSQKLTTLYNNY